MSEERLPTEVTDAEFAEMLGEESSWFNQQKPEKPEYDPRGQLAIHSIFPTIQGEGPFVGRTAVFIRLAGCNLQCPNCDTDYTSQRFLVYPPSLITEIQNVAGKSTLIVITGGEPFRQNIKYLVRMLISCGYTVQIETNGTLFVEGLPYSNKKLVICCSPKTPTISPKLRTLITYYKYVLDAQHIDEDGLPTSVLGMDHRPARPDLNKEVWVQPADEKNEEKDIENVRACLDSCFKHGYRLSLQLHKIVGLE